MHDNTKASSSCYGPGNLAVSVFVFVCVAGRREGGGGGGRGGGRRGYARECKLLCLCA